MQATLVQSHAGRIVLHVVAALRDHEWSWHWAGVVREL
jgi:hypothetical protein